MPQKIEEIFSILTKKHSLQEILNLGEKLLGNPISYSTTTMEIVAVSKSYPKEDKGIREFFIKNLTSENYKRILSQIEKRPDNTPFILEGIYETRKYLSKVYLSSKYMGYLSICEVQNDLSTLDSTLFRAISDACALSLNIYHGNTLPTGASSAQQNIIEGLLNENTRDVLNVKKQIEYSKLNELPSFRTLCICPHENTKTGAMLILQSTLKKLEGLHYQYWIIERYKFIVVVIGLPEDALTPIHDVLNEIVQKFQLVVGVSDIFHDILDVRHHYVLAKNSCVMAMRYGDIHRVIYYNDIKVYMVISEFLKKDRNLQDYYANELEIIKKYDTQNETCYYDTLEVYLFSGKNAIEASKKLFVHKNTINYRINRMLELFGIDTENYATVLRLQVSFLIKKMWDK